MIRKLLPLTGKSCTALNIINVSDDYKIYSLSTFYLTRPKRHKLTKVMHQNRGPRIKNYDSLQAYINITSGIWQAQQKKVQLQLKPSVNELK